MGAETCAWSLKKVRTILYEKTETQDSYYRVRDPGLHRGTIDWDGFDKFLWKRIHHPHVAAQRRRR